MNELWGLFVMVLAQAHLTYLLLKAELLRPLRERLARLGPRTAYLLQCPVCLGVWSALGVVLLPSPVVQVLAIAGAGSVVYELKEKYAPCVTCSTSKSVGNWRVVL